MTTRTLGPLRFSQNLLMIVRAYRNCSLSSLFTIKRAPSISSTTDTSSLIAATTISERMSCHVAHSSSSSEVELLLYRGFEAAQTALGFLMRCRSTLAPTSFRLQSNSIDTAGKHSCTSIALCLCSHCNRSCTRLVPKVLRHLVKP